MLLSHLIGLGAESSGLQHVTKNRMFRPHYQHFDHRRATQMTVECFKFWPKLLLCRNCNECDQFGKY